MRLNELISNILEKNQFPYDTISGLSLIPFRQEILNCDEFSEVEELIIVDVPTTMIDEEKIIVKTRISPKNFIFGKKVILYSFQLTPPTYDPKNMIEPIDNIGLYSPLLFNYEKDTSPYRNIILKFSPDISWMEDEIDVDDLNKKIPINSVREKLHRNLDLILDNPERFIPKGNRGLIIRGVFELKEIK